MTVNTRNNTKEIERLTNGKGDLAKVKEQAYKETVEVCLSALQAMPEAARVALAKAFNDTVGSNLESSVAYRGQEATFRVGAKAFGDAVKYMVNGWDIWDGAKTAPTEESTRTDESKAASLEPKFKRTRTPKAEAPAPVETPAPKEESSTDTLLRELLGKTQAIMQSQTELAGRLAVVEELTAPSK